MLEKNRNGHQKQSAPTSAQTPKGTLTQVTWRRILADAKRNFFLSPHRAFFSSVEKSDCEEMEPQKKKTVVQKKLFLCCRKSPTFHFQIVSASSECRNSQQCIMFHIFYHLDTSCALMEPESHGAKHVLRTACEVGHRLKKLFNKNSGFCSLGTGFRFSLSRDP